VTQVTIPNIYLLPSSSFFFFFFWGGSPFSGPSPLSFAKLLARQSPKRPAKASRTASLSYFVADHELLSTPGMLFLLFFTCPRCKYAVFYTPCRRCRKAPKSARPGQPSFTCKKQLSSAGSHFFPFFSKGNNDCAFLPVQAGPERPGSLCAGRTRVCKLQPSPNH